MSNIKTRIEKLEERQPCVCMVGLRYQGEQSINWNGIDYPDMESLSDALEEIGLQDERFIILTHYGRRP
jgi:hypothetical protein